jgi:hypothetical protein
VKGCDTFTMPVGLQAAGRIDGSLSITGHGGYRGGRILLSAGILSESRPRRRFHRNGHCGDRLGQSASSRAVNKCGIAVMQRPSMPSSPLAARVHPGLVDVGGRRSPGLPRARRVSIDHRGGPPWRVRRHHEPIPGGIIRKPLIDAADALAIMACRSPDARRAIGRGGFQTRSYGAPRNLGS